jgi:hypothetical protein
MRGNVLSHLVTWVLAMLPLAMLNTLMDFGLQYLGATPHLVPVALGEAVFRQAMLFLHFSLGASIGAFTYTAVVIGDWSHLPATKPIRFAGAADHAVD